LPDDCKSILEKNLFALNHKQKIIFDKVIGAIQKQNNVLNKNSKTNSSLPVNGQAIRLFVSGVAGKFIMISHGKIN
jgi:hypothetical protein